MEKPHKMVNGEKIFLTDEEIAFREKESAEWEAGKAKRDIKRQMQILEASVTQRRLREATLDLDNGWLASLNAQINELRKQLT